MSNKHQEMSRTVKLSSRKMAAIAALVSGLSKSEVAQTIGIRPETLSRYLQQPAFRLALAQASDQSLAEVSRTMLSGAGQMLGVLREVATDKGMAPAVRVRACLGWLDQMVKVRELTDLAGRIQVLEIAILHVIEGR